MTDIYPPGTIFITGSTGYVGSRLLASLSLRGRRVISVGRSSSCDLTFNQFVTLKGLADPILIHLAGIAHDLAGAKNLDEYYAVNVELTQTLLEAFVRQEGGKFVFISTIKAAEFDDRSPANPTVYAQTKYEAELRVRAALLGDVSRDYFILRPCLILGDHPKGNLRLLGSLAARGVPYPLGAYSNRKSLLSLDNFTFLIEKIVESSLAPGTYALSDPEPLAATELFSQISLALGRKPRIWSVPKIIVRGWARMGDHLPMGLNSERLSKLTLDDTCDSTALVSALGGEVLPRSTSEMITSAFGSEARSPMDLSGGR